MIHRVQSLPQNSHPVSLCSVPVSVSYPRTCEGLVLRLVQCFILLHKLLRLWLVNLQHHANRGTSDKWVAAGGMWEYKAVVVAVRSHYTTEVLHALTRSSQSRQGCSFTTNVQTSNQLNYSYLHVIQDLNYFNCLLKLEPYIQWSNKSRYYRNAKIVNPLIAQAVEALHVQLHF